MSAQRRPLSVPGGLGFQRSPTRDPAGISGQMAAPSVATVTALATIMTGWVHLHVGMMVIQSHVSQNRLKGKYARKYTSAAGDKNW